MPRRVSGERLIGREAELATVDALLAELAPAAGRPAPLPAGRGRGGRGKTRLVRELAERARSRGYQVATGGCVSNGAQVLPLNAVGPAPGGAGGHRAGKRRRPGRPGRRGRAGSIPSSS